MRRRTLMMLIALGLVALLAPNRASAQALPPVYGQGYGNYGRAGPALSPYLNMTRGGNPASNYFLGVLPEMDRRRTQAIQSREITDLNLRSDVLAQQQQALQEASVAPELTGGGLPPSGHAAAFTNYGSYFGLAAPASPAGRRQTSQTRKR